MEEPKVKDSIEVIINGFLDKVKIQELKKGHKKVQFNGNRPVVLDLNKESALSNIDIELQLLVSLNLSHCNLTYFPNIFEYKNNLKELNLSNNNLTEVPQNVYDRLGLLEQLDLSYNKISCFSHLPKCIYKLQTLRLNNNCFLNIPEFILKVCCVNLEELYYSFNEIVNLSASQFLYRGPYRLKKLEFRNCCIRSPDLEYLKQIRTLKELDLSNENASKRNCIDVCTAFETFLENPMWNDQLTILKINDLQISDLPKTVYQLVALQELYLSKNDLMWLPDSINLLKELRVLDVSLNKLFALPSSINKLMKLEVLKAASNNISDIPDFPTLSIKHLDLYDNCLDKCCFINWDIILFLDLECNYFCTQDLPISYKEKKTALRHDLNYCRKDEHKEVEFDADLEDDSVSSVDKESIGDCCNGEFKPGYVEESWSSSTDDYDNGCTASDNEWKGFEIATVKRKIIKRRIERPPSWMLGDID